MKVGDLVKVFYFDTLGVIVDSDSLNGQLRYKVAINDGGFGWFSAENVTPLKKPWMLTNKKHLDNAIEDKEEEYEEEIELYKTYGGD